MARALDPVTAPLIAIQQLRSSFDEVKQFSYKCSNLKVHKNNPP
jgi:hypothetical protein